MESCDCPHPATAHAPVQDFGASMCARRAERNRVPETLVTLIRDVLENRMPRTTDDTARNIAAVLLATFEMSER